MDSELEIFLQSFRELQNLFRTLPLTPAQIQQLDGSLTTIQKNAKDLALYDVVTRANARVAKWLLPTN